MGSCVSYFNPDRASASIANAQVNKKSSNAVKYNNKMRSLLMNMPIEKIPKQTYLFTQARIIKVYDGDTFYIATWHDGRIQQFPVRLYGIDTPELKNTKGEERMLAQLATEYMKKLVNKLVDIEVLTNTPELKRGDPFGRLIARIHYKGVDIARDLIAQNLAVEYYGGKKDKNKMTQLIAHNRPFSHTGKNT